MKNGAGRFASSNPVLQPAFDYIFTHKHENFSLKEMAKRLLESTDSPIHPVSDDLGFCDTGYFIKTFKKFENLTPAVYRNMYAGISAK
ncbi:helix-turn-helix domain-containing protein [Paenibacillus sp. cl141a]|uniref:helix-turn-helix domain-containing protein n=1 Tax=Paenibacillus sp. cl141a TaxID=1761877 RepID=UPI000B894E6F